MSLARASLDFSKISRVKVTKSQYLLATIALISLLLLGVSSILESRSAGDRTKMLSDIETPAASIIFTQRETLVYSTRLALWSNGGTTRRDVQIARALLAQRLAVIDSSGRTMGSRANQEYWRALRKADAIVAAAPMGVLPEDMHGAINEDLLPVIDEIVEQARALVVSYQRSVDAEMQDLAEETARRDALNLSLLYLFIFTGGLFLFLNARTNYRNFQAIRGEIDREQRELEIAHNRVAQLQDLDQAKNALISNVNHELRTPLTSIIGYIELMQRDNPEAQSAQQRLYLEVLERNSYILLNLVESLLSLSKFDSGVGKLPNKQVSLNEVLDSALFTLRPALEKADIQITYSAELQLFIRGDIAQLNQLFINLIANAIKFSPQGSTVEVAISKDATSIPRAQITIKDQGIGMLSEDIPSIFNRFYRGTNADADNYEGTGLGLAIVQQVINHHGGSIEVESTIGKGSTFTIYFPLSDGESADE
jgi:signal transduction histidine kinase